MYLVVSTELKYLKFQQQNVPLSPHPTEKQSFPRKLSNNLITISRMEKSEHSHSPVLTYEFSKSPGKVSCCYVLK